MAILRYLPMSRNPVPVRVARYATLSDLMRAGKQIRLRDDAEREANGTATNFPTITADETSPTVSRIDATLHALGEDREVPVLFQDRAWLLQVRKPGDEKWRYVGPTGRGTSKPQAMTLFGDAAHAALKKARLDNPGLEFAMEQGSAEWMLWGTLGMSDPWVKITSGTLTVVKREAKQRGQWKLLAIVPKGLHPGDSL